MTKMENLPEERNDASRHWLSDSGGDWSRASAVICVGSSLLSNPQERVWVGIFGVRRCISGEERGREDAVIVRLPVRRMWVWYFSDENSSDWAVGFSTASFHRSTAQRPAFASFEFCFSKNQLDDTCLSSNWTLCET